MALTHSLQLLRRTATAAFWQNFEGFPTIMDGIAQEVTSTADQETYPWLAYAPGVQEMVGGRRHRSVPALDWTIANKKWESTVDIGYELWRFNKLNAVSAMMGNLGAKARAYPSKLVSTLINDGEATACYDGQFFFDTDHSDPGSAYTTSQDNDLTDTAVDSGATAITDVEMRRYIATCRAALFGFKDGDGDPVWPGEDFNMVVMCHPDVGELVERVQTVDQLTGPVGNDMQGKFTTRRNPWLNAWATEKSIYVFNTSGARKPFIHQVADPVRLEDDLGKLNEYETKDVSFGSFGYYNVDYGDWRYAVKMTITTA